MHSNRVIISSCLQNVNCARSTCKNMKLETNTRGIGLPGMEALSFTVLVAHGGVGVAAAGCGGKRCFFFFSPLFWFVSVFLCFFLFTLLSLFLSFVHSPLFFCFCSPLSAFFSCCLFCFLRCPSLCFLFLTFPLSLFFFLPIYSVPPLTFIGRGCRCFLVTADVYHSGEGVSRETCLLIEAAPLSLLKHLPYLYCPIICF